MGGHGQRNPTRTGDGAGRSALGPVRLKDVARCAGVSVATVSAVARGATGGSVRISEPTRTRVLAAIDELGYRPNTAARSLRTQRTGLLAVVVPDITNPLFPQFIRAAQLEAERVGSHLMVWDSHNDADSERAAVDAALDRRVDGVVLVSDHLTAGDAQRLLDAGILVVTTDRRIDRPFVDTVSEDLTSTAATAVDHLVALGHRRIAHIAGDRATVAGESRVVGYLNALESAGVAPDPSLLVGGSFGRHCGRDSMVELMGRSEPPTAVFAANDVLAVGALQTCHHLGVAVPDDVSIIGIDNTPEADAVTPGLSTMETAPNRIAERLVQLASSRLNDRRDAGGLRELITASLVQRGSTAALPPAPHVTARSTTPTVPTRRNSLPKEQP
jgi:LacI family transcriptional regulator, galactose operon repressor